MEIVFFSLCMYIHVCIFFKQPSSKLKLKILGGKCTKCMRRKMKDKNGEIIKLDATAGDKPRYTFRLSVMKYRHVW